MTGGGAMPPEGGTDHFEADGHTTWGTNAMGCRVERLGDGWQWQVWRADQSAEGFSPTAADARAACVRFWDRFISELREADRVS